MDLQTPLLIKHTLIQGPLTSQSQIFCPRCRNYFQNTSLDSMVYVPALHEIHICTLTSVTSTLLVVQFISVIKIQRKHMTMR